MSLADIMRGKQVNDVPSAVWEFMFMSSTNMSLNDIRSLSEKDFKTFSPMVDMLFRMNVQKLGISL